MSGGSSEEGAVPAWWVGALGLLVRDEGGLDLVVEDGEKG